MSSDSGVKIRFVDEIAIVELTGVEKRFNLDYLKKLHGAYDEVLRSDNHNVIGLSYLLTNILLRKCLCCHHYLILLFMQSH